MKPLSIVLSIILGLASLSLVVWVGRFGAPLPKTTAQENEKPKVPATADDLPMPASGPFGKAEISETVFNFGMKHVGQKDEHIFTIKNVGEGVLEFKLGKPTCQCTVGEITRENGEVINEGPINPGEKVNILVRWQMKAKLEQFRQVVPVFTTDPDRRKVEFAIMGSVDNPIAMYPEGVWQFGDMSMTEPSTIEGYVASKVFDTITLSEEPRDNPRCKVSWEPASPENLEKHQAKCAYVVKVTAGPDVPIGVFREAIKLKVTWEKEEAILDFVVLGRRGGPIEIRWPKGANFDIETSRLMMGEFPASKGKRCTVTFIARDINEELVLKSLDPVTTAVKVTIPEKGTVMGASKSYQAEFEIPPGPPAQHRRENAEPVILKFNHPTAPDLKILVDYHAR